MSSRETLYNSICYNVFLINLWSAAIVQLMIQIFKTSLSDINASGDRSAWHNLFYDNISKLYFHGAVYKYSVFIYMTLGVAFIYLIYMFMYPKDLEAVMRMNESKIKSYNKYKDKDNMLVEKNDSINND